MDKSIIYASNDHSRALYDQDGNLIVAQRHGDDDYYMIAKLLERLGYSLAFAALPDLDGEYPKTIS